LPLLVAGHSAAITLSQEQAALLLANSFLATFPRRNKRGGEYANYPDINMNRMLRSLVNTTTCAWHLQKSPVVFDIDTGANRLTNYTAFLLLSNISGFLFVFFSGVGGGGIPYLAVL
jgi:hypothetical protein